MDSNEQQSNSGPPDEQSRRELERLEKQFSHGLSGTKRQILLLGGVLSLVVALVLYQDLSIHTTLLAVMGGGITGTLIASYILLPTVIWPLLQKRADKIRAGSSYKAPSEYKDWMIAFWSSIFFFILSGAFRLLYVPEILVVSAFLTITSLVLWFWSVTLIAKALRKAPKGHLRRLELLISAFLTAVFVLVGIALIFVRELVPFLYAIYIRFR